MNDENKKKSMSVRMKLKNIAVKENKQFDFILLLYMAERLIYRLGVSRYKSNFLLKGGLLLYVSMLEMGRPTRDIDFLARQLVNNLKDIADIFKEVCAIEYDDGLKFDVQSITTERIKEDADYEGVRVKIKCYLENAINILQLDIGFGDVVVPKPVLMDYPVILDMERPEIQAYSMESVIAEKFEAMISLSWLNSRMKDFYDVYMLSENYEFDGRILYEAIFETFQRRGTNYSRETAVFSDEFAVDLNKKKQWNAFIKRILNSGISFIEVTERNKNFLLPIYETLLSEKEFFGKWSSKKGTWIPLVP